MNLLALAGDIDALIAEIRLRVPLGALAERSGWTLRCRSFHDCTRADLAAADVAIFQRAGTPRALRLEQAMQSIGGAVVYEIDDLLTELPPHVSNAAAVRSRVATVRRCIATADAVSASTARLAAELGHPDTVVVPNHAWSLGDLPLPAADPGRPVHLVVASMERLGVDFIAPALRAVQAAAGDDVRVVAFGPAGDSLAAAGVAVQRQPLLPRARFVEAVRALPNPVAVIPLESSRFAACKSAIKWFEYAEAGVPVTCSAVEPYRDVVDDGATGWLVANTAADWQAALAAVIADADARQRTAVAARRCVRERHGLDRTLDGWRRVVERARDRRDAAGAWLPPLGWRLGDAAAAGVETVALQLRRINRARLARRRRAR